MCSALGLKPINTVGPYKDRFLPLRERSELPHLLLYFSSVFSLKDNIQYPPMKFLLADYVPYSITWMQYVPFRAYT
jgi:hypothetical protein